MKVTLGTPTSRWDWHRKMLLRLRDELSAARNEHENAVRIPHERGGTDPVDFTEDELELNVLRAELAQPRLLRSPYVSYSDATVSELGVLKAAREIRAAFGERAIRNYIISHTEAVSDLLEVLLLQKEGGLLKVSQGMSEVMVIPLFETIPDLQRAANIMETWMALPPDRKSVV